MIERIVGTVRKDMLMLEPRLVPGADAPVSVALKLPQAVSPMSAKIPRMASQALRHMMSSLVIGGTEAGGLALDPDPEAGPAETEDGGRQQDQAAKDPPR